MGRPATLKASFVIPVYNGQAFIAQAIRSCLNQSVKGIEVIVVDDGSTDNTARIIKSMASEDARVKPHILPHNVGRCMARNTGNGLAASDIFVLDADDISLPNRVADTLAYWKKYPGTDIVYGKFHAINMMGEIIGIADVKQFNINEVIKTGMCFIGHSTMAYKRHVIDKVSYTPGEWDKHCIDDWKFQIDSHKAGFTFGACNKIFAQYRVNPKARDEAKIKELKDAWLNEPVLP